MAVLIIDTFDVYEYVCPLTESKALHSYDVADDIRSAAIDSGFDKNPAKFKRLRRGEAAAAGRMFEQLFNSTRAALIRSTNSYLRGKTSKTRWMKEVKQALRESYTKAFELGLKSSGSKKVGASVSDEDASWVESAFRHEMRYFNDLLNGIVDDSYSGRLTDRLTAYAESLKHVFYAGKVMGTPSGMVVDWICPLDRNTCLPGGSMVVTEDGPRTISEIVDGGYSGKVLSIDSGGQLVYSPVVGRRRRPNSGKRWVALGSSNLGRLVCTDDHRCAVIEDIIRPTVSYTQAKDIVGKYVAVLPRGRKDTPLFSPLYNREQVSAMIGCLLGDGSIHRHTFVTTHGRKQREYLEFKLGLFGGRIKETRSGWRKEDPAYMLLAPQNSQTSFLRGLIYLETGKSPTPLLPYLDDIGMAFWYMDDGSMRRGVPKQRGPTALFCTDSFRPEDNLKIIGLFRGLGIGCRLGYLNRIYLTVEGSRVLWSRIAKYVPECMDYKIPEEYRVREKHTFDNSRLSIGATFVRDPVYIGEENGEASIREKRLARSDLYDIEVEGTHNFVADGFIVHNCNGCRFLSEHSPYVKESIPTTPRAGSTRCLNNCRCKLVARDVGKEVYERVYSSQRSKDWFSRKLEALKAGKLLA